MKKFSRVVALAAASLSLVLTDPAMIIANGSWVH